MNVSFDFEFRKKNCWQRFIDNQAPDSDFQ